MTVLQERQEWAQPFLIVFSVALAYFLPFEGLFISYAILGPAHYLTQLNWLHDRKFFIRNDHARYGYLAIMFFGLIVALYVDVNPFIFGFYILSMLCMAAFLLSARVHENYLWLLLGCFVVIGLFFTVPLTLLLASLLVPTIIHVGMFTLIFLMQGARKKDNIAAKVSVLTWVAGFLMIIVTPPEVKLTWSSAFNDNRSFFDGVAGFLGSIDPQHNALNKSWSLGYGLLTFAYTYHYLNWFSKTDLLKWHLIEKRRLYPIVLIYILAVGLYAYDYQMGWKVLLFLSVLHVTAEFPLDFIALKALFTRAPKPPA